MSEQKKNSFAKNKFLILAVICLLGSLAAFSAYLYGKDDASKLDDLTYVEGQMDYSYSPWIYRYRYWGLRRRRALRQRSLDIFLENDVVRYSAGSYLINNLYEDPFYRLVYDYPRPNAILGYINTEDPFVKEVYSIEIDGMQLVNTNGIKEDIQNQKIVQIILTIILLLAGVLLLLKHSSKGRKEI